MAGTQTSNPYEQQKQQPLTQEQLEIIEAEKQKREANDKERSIRTTERFMDSLSPAEILAAGWEKFKASCQQHFFDQLDSFYPPVGQKSENKNSNEVIKKVPGKKTVEKHEPSKKPETPKKSPESAGPKEQTKESVDRSQFKSLEDAFVYFQERITDPKFKEATEVMQKMVQMHLFVDLWSTSANKTAWDMWFKSVREADDIINGSASRNVDILTQYENRIVNGSLPNKKSFDIVLSWLMENMRFGENESYVLGMERLKQSETLLRSNLAPEEIRRQLYTLFRESGHYDEVVPHLGEDLLAQKEFVDVQAVLGNPKTIDYIKTKNLNGLKSLGCQFKIEMS
jgi:hypothetical protein